MLDTNIFSYLVKRQHPYYENVKNKILDAKEGSICISVISLAEISLGLERIKIQELRKQKLTNAINYILESIVILEVNDEAGWMYGKIREELIKNNQDIGLADCLIAAHAITNNVTLVTNNVKHFQRIKNLKIQNWAENHTNCDKKV
jgi:tRNA(fMet)-specific endonuclease VapC